MNLRGFWGASFFVSIFAAAMILGCGQTFAAIIVSGTVYSDEGVSAVSSSVTLVVGGATAYTTSTLANGTYSIDGIAQPATSSVITVFMNNNGSGNGLGAAVTKYSGSGNIAGLDLYASRLIARDDGGGPATNANLAVCTKTLGAACADSDLHFDVSGGALTVDNDWGLYIWPGRTFSPGGAVTLSPGAVAASAGGDIKWGSAYSRFIIGTSSLSVGGDWNNSAGGEFRKGTGQTTNFTATQPSTTINIGANSNYRAFDNLTLNGVGGSWSISAATLVAGNLTITNGTLNANGQDIYLLGNYTNNGVFAGGSGTLHFLTSSSTNGTLSGTMTGGSALNNVVMGGGAWAGGVQTVDPSTGSDAALAIAIDTTYEYVAGYQRNCPLGNECWRFEKRNLSDGSLVFATTSDPTTLFDQARSLVISGSFMYAVGYQGGEAGCTSYCWRIEKRNLSDGALVYSTTSDPTAGTDIPLNLKTDGTFMYISGYQATGGTCSAGSDCWRIEKRNLSDGVLVYATTSDPTSGIDQPWVLAIDDTYLYAAGYQATGGTCSTGSDCWRMEKRNLSDGALIFATTTDPTSGSDQIRAISADTNFMYLGGQQATGGTCTTGSACWRIEKRNLSDGVLVYATTSDPTTGFDIVTTVMIDGSAMYLGGIREVCPGSDCIRYEKRNLEDGVLLYTTTTDVTSDFDEPYSLASDGIYMYVAGLQGNGAGCTTGSLCWRLEKRSLSDGALAAGGARTASSSAAVNNLTISGGTFNAPSALTVTGNYTNSGVFTNGTGTVTFAGAAQQTATGTLTGTSAFHNLAFTNSGSSSVSFGTAATVNGNFTITSGTVNASGVTLMVGGSYTNNGTFTAGNGTVIFLPSSTSTISGALSGSSAFNTVIVGGGTAVMSDPSNGDDTIRVVANDGTHLYTLGLQGAGCVLGNTCWRIEKHLLSDGSLIYATSSDPTNSFDTPNGLKIDGTFMYTVGYDANGGFEWRIEKRNLSDGVLVYATTSDPTVGSDAANNISIDSVYMYVVGTQSTGCGTGGDCWRIEKRNLSDGVLVYATTSDPTNGFDGPNDIVNDGSYMYVVGTQSTGCSVGSFCWRIEKRNLSDGVLVYATTSDPTNGFDSPSTIAIDNIAMYIGGSQSSDCSNGGSCIRIEKRNLSDGALVYATTSDPSSGSDNGNGMIVKDSFMFLAGSQSGSCDTGGSCGRIEKRNLSDGALVYATTSDPTASSDSFVGITSNGNFLYAGGYQSTGGTCSTGLQCLHIEKRTLANLNPAFGTAAFSSAVQIGALTIDGTFTAPSSLTITGNYTNNGLFTNNSGTVTFGGTTQQTATGTMTGVSAFYNLAVTNNGASSPDLLFGVSASSTGTFTVTAPSAEVAFAAGSTYQFQNILINGQSTSTPVVLRSSPVGSLWNLAVPGTVSVVNTSVADSNACAGPLINLTDVNVINSGNDSCWTFYVPGQVAASLGGYSGGSASRSGGASAPAQLPATSSPVKTNLTTSTAPRNNLATSTPVTSTIFKAPARFTKSLRPGARSEEVRAFQRFLNTAGFIIAKTGAGSPGGETTYFGALTREALKKYQCARGIVCAGTEQTTGWGSFGPRTRAMVNADMGM